MKRLLIACALAASVLALPAAADEAVPTLNDPVAAKREVELAKQLRCLVCQNETIADSRADLAKDLRSKLREQMAAGKTDEEIIAFMTDRYGDFVLYRPPLKATTVLLWAGPFLLLAVGVLIGWRVIRARARAARPQPLSAAERERAERLLRGEGDAR
ncbi:MAG: cytochrome c-type biogenesis protein CcmH [Burkholderiales bacterium]|nr:MAG: cytochrome c-type biogenesis protein CcmH [Burkholderiales bacterium]